MENPDLPIEASIHFAIDVDITDPGELQSYAVTKAESPEHTELAATNLFAALAVAMDPLAVAADVPGVRILRGKVEPAQGHGVADQVLPSAGGEAEREPADTGIGGDAVATLLAASERAGGIELELLGYDPAAPEAERELSRHRARVLAGLLWHAGASMIDELFNDLDLLRDREPTAADIDETYVLDNLPPQYAHHYDARFAARFLTVCTDLTTNIAAGWKEPSCVAQELALRCLLAEAEFLADELDLDAELPANWVARLEQLFLQFADSMMLFDPAMDGFENDPDAIPEGAPSMKFEDWFKPFGPGHHVPPFAERG
ncbi:hypothetical protein D477_002096 [Arthrobacter crystallopoietes BAB-32]|uniref:Uncharacterized protein n=1 Tax=Arthrobacter crystallopoietes BAB-32 TaxID=1246476 RepID=N1V6W9_9MICC|nr:hypothetical protein [Arthrobacter crystallopoietes]EMY35837.1 hypothetical protein D477_002096 [Arthrobacter crystallopoietes BAB-32]